MPKTSTTSGTPAPEPRKGMPSVQLDEGDFRDRFLQQYADPRFDEHRDALDRIAGVAFRNYDEGRKSPNSTKAGPGYADPDYELADDWRAAKEAIEKAQAEHDDPDQPPCILIVNGSSRSEHTCPGEMSKSWRLTEIAREICEADGMKVRILNLSRRNMERTSTLARPASRPPRRSATGRAAATPTIRWARRRT